MVVSVEDVLSGFALRAPRPLVVWGTGRLGKVNGANGDAVAALVARGSPSERKARGVARALASADEEEDEDDGGGKEEEEEEEDKVEKGKVHGGGLDYWLPLASSAEKEVVAAAEDALLSESEDDEPGSAHPLASALQGTPILAGLVAGRHMRENMVLETARLEQEAHERGEGSSGSEDDSDSEDPKDLTRRQQLVASLRMVRSLQRTSGSAPVMPFAPFAAAVASTSVDYVTSLLCTVSWSPVALHVLALALEEHLTALLQDALLSAIHSQRLHVQPKDIQLSRRLRAERF